MGGVRRVAIADGRLVPSRGSEMCRVLQLVASRGGHMYYTYCADSMDSRVTMPDQFDDQPSHGHSAPCRVRKCGWRPRCSPPAPRHSNQRPYLSAAARLRKLIDMYTRVQIHHTYIHTYRMYVCALAGSAPCDFSGSGWRSPLFLFSFLLPLPRCSTLCLNRPSKQSSKPDLAECKCGLERPIRIGISPMITAFHYRWYGVCI